jgi:Plasmid pRiA4b ORF-3-like protein
MHELPEPNIYQFKVVLSGISPMIWRRLLVLSDCTIADLHYIVQIAMGWTDSHLHRFIIHGKQYGIAKVGGIGFSDNPWQVKLSDFGFRVKEKFTYEYDFFDHWQHQIRVETILPFNPQQQYPLCLEGKRSPPPEDCGGAWKFLELRQHYSTGHAAVRLVELCSEIVDTGVEALDDSRAELLELQKWLSLECFERREVNRRLHQYATGDGEWLFTD